MIIDIDLIDPPAHPVRHQVDKEADASLEASIRALGVLTPVLVIGNGDRFALIAGNRRVRAARAVGLQSIPAQPAAQFDAGYAHAAATAENIVRAPMAPVDQWRAIVEMQRLGHTLPTAAAALGLSERMAGRLSKLGHLHPDMLALIEQHGLPPYHNLQDIAMASPERQAHALKAKGAVTKLAKGIDISWWKIAEACQDHRIPRERAMFDVTTAGVVFEQDLFAEPGSDDEWTTTNVAGFMAAQQAAIEARAKAKKQALQVVPVKQYQLQVPKGWQITERSPTRAPKKNETAFVGIHTEGQQIGEVLTAYAIDTKAEQAKAKAAEKKAAEKAKAKAKPDTSADPVDAVPAQLDEVSEDDAEEAAPLPEPKSPLTQAGQKMLADAKTEALRKALRDRMAISMPLDELCIALVLALHADNVDVRGYQSPRGVWKKGRDLVARLISPDGAFTRDREAIVEAATETLARCLRIDGPDKGKFTYQAYSGPVAEWIGEGVQAADWLPPFDTPEFLVHVNAETLRAAAKFGNLVVKSSDSAGKLREKLAGATRGWSPPGAAFGAPGPKPQTVAFNDDEGDED